VSSSVVVVGAGLAGLSAACYLAGAGYEVTVVERDDRPGGRAGRIERQGYTFDTGPTVMTMPGLLADVVSAAGSRLEDLLPMTQLDPAYRARFADGSEIHVRAGHEAMRAEIAAQCGPQDAAAFDDFVRWLRELYDLEMPRFIDRNFDSPLDLLSSPSAAARLLRTGGFRRLGSVVSGRFQDERLRRLFSFQAMYAGLPPSRALAIYAVITYMDSVKGVYFPDGGMGAIPVAMARAAEAAGVDFRWGTTAHEVLRGPNGRVAAVDLGQGDRLRADAVVCTLDLPVAYPRLFPDLKPPRAVRSGRYSPSAVVWHVGTRGAPAAGTAHHNIHFGRDWDASFDALIRDLRLMPDPSRLVTVPSLTEPSLAAPGGSTLYVLEPVPHLGGDVDWTSERGPMRDRLLSFLAAEGYPTDIVTEELVTPLEWEAMGMAQGTPFALAHTFFQTGPFRPPNVERRMPGLVFAGSGTVPGVGVPMVLLSGRLAAERVREYLPTTARAHVPTTARGIPTAAR
jgi:phytoene desaturase